MVEKVKYVSRVTPDSDAKDKINNFIDTSALRCVVGRIPAVTIAASAYLP